MDRYHISVTAKYEPYADERSAVHRVACVAQGKDLIPD